MCILLLLPLLFVSVADICEYFLRLIVIKSLINKGYIRDLLRKQESFIFLRIQRENSNCGK